MKTSSQTLPSSPTHSSSSSEFEFTVSQSCNKTFSTPADDLFYKGQLLPLHLSPRISMLQTLILSSSSSSSSATTATARHSSDSFDVCDSSRPSSVTDDDQTTRIIPTNKPNKYFSRFSSVFRKETNTSSATPTATATVTASKRVREMIRKYVKKARPLYEKLSSATKARKENDGLVSDNLFSTNLRYPRRWRRSCVSSCPSSMRSSPTHSGVLCRNSVVRTAGGIYSSNSSSMEELQSAIQGAIAHCKNSMTQHK